MWFFADESWTKNKAEAVIGGFLVDNTLVEEADQFLFQVKKRYFGISLAKDIDFEFKGRNLFSKDAIKHHRSGYSRNISAARECLEWLAKHRKTKRCLLIASVVYGTRPSLLGGQTRRLETPFCHLYESIDNIIQQEFHNRGSS